MESGTECRLVESGIKREPVEGVTERKLVGSGIERTLGDTNHAE